MTDTPAGKVTIHNQIASAVPRPTSFFESSGWSAMLWLFLVLKQGANIQL